MGSFSCCSMQMFLIELQNLCRMERYLHVRYCMKARYLHLIVTYLGLLHRNVAAPHDQTSVLMAHSTEVSHWPSGHDVRKKFSPDIGKCGVSHRVYGDGRFCHTTIFFPHRSLGGVEQGRSCRSDLLYPGM